MYDAGKTAQVVAEMKLAVLGLCETRWTQSGQVCLPSYDLPFYEMFQGVIDKKAKKDILILMGDFNAKVGKDNTGKEQFIGTHGEEQENENGELLSDFCMFNGFVIVGTFFPHKRIHKVHQIILLKTRLTTSASAVLLDTP